MDCTTADASLAAADRLMLSYRMEGQELHSLKKGTANAEQCTIQFGVKATKTGTYVLELYDHDNTRHCAKSYTGRSTDTWEKQEITFPADTTGEFGNDTGKSFELQFYLGAGTNHTSGTLATTWAATVGGNRATGQVNCADSTSNDFLLTGLQMEVGSSATDFEHAPYDYQLRRCQRYYIDYTGRTINGDLWLGWPVEMRNTPTLTDTVGTAANGKVNGCTLNHSSAADVTVTADAEL